MLNTLSIYEDLSRYMDQQAARKIAELMGQVYEEIAQTVTKEESRELRDVILRLAEAQRRTEAKVEELARAQERTEESLNRLIGEHRETRERLENMSDAVGYNLENQSYKGLPQLLLRDYGLQVQGKLIRKYLPGKKKGKYFQANIYGWGNKDGEKILILGEAKKSISRKEVNRFEKKINKMAELEKVPLDKVFQVIVVHDVTPGVEEYAKEQGFHLYWSYDL